MKNRIGLAALLPCALSCAAELHADGGCELPNVQVTSPAALNATASIDVQQPDSGVGVACAGSTCVAIWSVSGLAGLDQDLFVSRSLDHGVTWSEPALLNSNAAVDTQSDFGVVVGGDGAGTWIALWQSQDSLDGTIGGDHDILFSRSVDDGVTWSPVAPLNSNAAKDAGNDFNPALASDGAGTWLAVWHSNEELGGLGNDLDILASRSADGGMTWSFPAAINELAARDGAISDGNPAVACTGTGAFVAAWASNSTLGGTIGSDVDLIMRRSIDGGATWQAEQALNSDAASDTNIDETWLSLASDGANHVVAAWARDMGDDLDIYSAFSTDAGDTWSTPAIMNQNGATDSADDKAPVVAYDPAGMWITAWYTPDTFNGTFSTDHDVLFAYSADGGATWSREQTGNRNAGADGDHHDEEPSIAVAANGDWILAWHSTMPITLATGDDNDILHAIIHPLEPGDCNGDKVGDVCQVRDGILEDDNFDGIPDVCQPEPLPIVKLRKVAVQGERTPAGGTYTELMGHQCNAASDVIYAFRPSPYAIAVWEDGVSTAIAIGSTQAPGAPPGVNFGGSTPFSRMAVSDDGPMAFYASLQNQPTTSDFGMWYWDGVQVSLIAREGDQLDNVPPGIVWDNFEQAIGSARPRIGSTGVVGFAARITGPGVTPDFDTGIWRWDNGVETIVVQEGTPAPGTGTTFTAFNHPRLDAAGKLAIHAYVQGNLEGIWFGGPGTLQNLALEGQAATGYPPGVVFSVIDERLLVSRNGHVVFRCVASGPGVSNSNNESIWRHYQGSTELVVKDGDSAPDITDDAVLINVRPMAIMPDGKIVLAGNFSTPSITSDTSALWVERDDGFHLVAREGTQPPGAASGHTFQGLTDAEHVAANGAGEVLFMRRLNGETTSSGVWGWMPNRGLFAAGCVGQVVIADEKLLGTGTGAAISGYDIGASPGPSATLNDNGDFSIHIAYHDGEQPRAGIFLGSFPEATDFNDDGIVNHSDFSLLCAALGSVTGAPGFDPVFDLNIDGVVDHLDQAQFLEGFAAFCVGDIVASATFAPPPDGLVDGADLAVLLGAWGAQSSCADFVTSATFAPPPDGVVDGADLAVLLGGWGGCNQ